MAVPHNRRRLHVVLPGTPLHEIDEQVVGLVADGEIPEWETPEAVAQWVHDLRYRPESLTEPLEDRER